MNDDVVSFCPVCLESWIYSWALLYHDRNANSLLEHALYAHIDAHRGTM